MPTLLEAQPEIALRLPMLGSTLTIHSSRRTAGAIDSIKFRGKEFVESYDHGREWQSAVSYDGLGECLNPTEAGSNQDGTGPDTSSELFDAHKGDATLYTTVRMAYWLKPDEPYKDGCGTKKDKQAARNKTVLSDDTVIKQVNVGYNGIANVLEFLVTLNVAEPHESLTFEAVTGYMPPDFSLLLAFDPATGQVAPLSAGPGEQSLPVIVSTNDRKSAVGVYSPELPQAEFPNSGYGRFLLLKQPGPAVKWNCVFRGGETKPGPIVHRCLVAIGSVDEVRDALQQLVKNAK